MTTRELLMTADEIRTIVSHLAEQLKARYDGQNPILLCILKGSFILTADLFRALDMDAAVEFVTISSYDDSYNPRRWPEVSHAPAFDKLTGRHVIIVDDIADHGRTMEVARSNVLVYQPASVAACVLLSKPGRKLDWVVPAEFIGLEIENDFVVGYGMGDGEADRNLPDLWIVRE